jgi:ABC-2 type transport system ATP-binding protein
MTNLVELNKINLNIWWKEILKDLSFSIQKWEIVWFLWQNWAWKSSTMKILSGLLKQKSWSYKFNWDEFSLENLTDIWAIINHPTLYENLNAYNNLKVFSNLEWVKMTKSDFDKLLDTVWLYEDSRKQKVWKYSTWMKQMLAIAVSLIWKPKLLVMDEITSWLDALAKKRARDLLIDLKNAWYSIIFSSHELDQIHKVSDRIVIIANKTIQFEWTLKEMEKYWDDIEQCYLNLIK